MPSLNGGEWGGLDDDPVDASIRVTAGAA